MIFGSHRARTAAIVRAHLFVGGKRGRRGKLPRQRYPAAIERSYAAAIGDLFSRERVRAAFAPLLEALPDLLVEARVDTYTEEGVERSDAGRKARDFAASVRARLHRQVTASAVESLARTFAVQVSAYQRAQLNRQVRHSFGVEVATADRRLIKRVDNWAAENVSLITNISDEVARRVERRVLAAIGSGARTTRPLAAELEDEFGFGEGRARLIARDQVGKLFGRFNADRQVELGVERFTWRTMMDDRVRADHQHLEGEVYAFEDGGHPSEGLPGEPIQCRCVAEPIFDDVLNEEDA